MIRFISFASPGFETPMRALLESARVHGADSTHGWTRAELCVLPEYAEHRSILDAPRGSGYWAWKPLIIRAELAAMSEGDVLVYCDAGRAERPQVVDRALGPVVDHVVREHAGMLPGVYIPQWGPNRRWTKRECLLAMDCDTPAVRDHCQIQASFSIWQAHRESREFVAEWARWCLDARAVADERVNPAVIESAGFIDHRHDQSILTNLAVSRGLRAFGDPVRARLGPYPHSPIDKDLGTLADRLAGRSWAIARRLADEQLRASDLAAPPRGLWPRARRALRWAKAFARTWPYAVAGGLVP